MLGEEHFLVDPERFIFDHFPADPKMQLLARPIAEEEFSEMACVNNVYFDWDILYMSHPKGTITTNTGALQLYFKTKPKSEITFRYVLFKHTERVHLQHEASGHLNRNHLNQLVRLENKGDYKCFQICLKNIGLYKLQIFAPSANRKGTDLYMLVQYVIRCYCPFFGQAENPVMPTGLQELGPGAAWKTLGIETKLYGGIITAKEGHAKLKSLPTKQ